MKQEKSKSKLFLYAIMFFCTISIAGCGGSGGGGGNPEVPPPDNTGSSDGSGLTSGVFLDSAVEGLHYLSGSKLGLTDGNGTFQIDGSTVQFSVGDIVLGQGTAKSVMTPIDLVPGAIDETNPAVTNITRIFLTLDDDGNPDNGIFITQAVRDAAIGKSIDFEQDTDIFEGKADIQLIVSELTALTSVGTRPLVSAANAQEHLHNTLFGGPNSQPNNPEGPRLLVLLNDSSEGRVTSSVGEINCGVDCLGKFTLNQTAVLTAIPKPGFSFLGWEVLGQPGACSSIKTCTITMDGDKVVDAFFWDVSGEINISVEMRGFGQGVLMKDGVPWCNTPCNGRDFQTEVSPEIVTLSAAPSEGSIFSGWSGDCTGMGLCSVSLDGDKSVTAKFDLAISGVPVSISSLTIKTTGFGKGEVTTTPSAKICRFNPSSCGSTPGMVITLTPQASPGSIFSGWAGACTGMEACVLTMDSDETVTATFDYAVVNSGIFTLTVINELFGGISDTPPVVESSPAGIDCGSVCSNAYDSGSLVTLTPVVPTGKIFNGWVGDCKGLGPCTISMNSDKVVGALFADLCCFGAGPAPDPFILTVNVDGSGIGLVNDGFVGVGINCLTNCSAEVEPDSTVTLTAFSGEGSIFSGWSGACTGLGDCTVTMDENKGVTATFELDGLPS